MDKIKYITCSVNKILKLINIQIQNIIYQVTSKTVFLENDQNHISLKTTNGDQNNTKISTTSCSLISRTNLTYN